MICVRPTDLMDVDNELVLTSGDQGCQQSIDSSCDRVSGRSCHVRRLGD